MLQFCRILACCAYYFPTTMALMYCYGSGFHVSKARSKCSEEPIRPNGVPVPCSKVTHIEHEAVVSFTMIHFQCCFKGLFSISSGTY